MISSVEESYYRTLSSLHFPYCGYTYKIYNKLTMTSDRPTTTLFLLTSLDGKISTGDNDERDTDTDFHRIVGIKEGLQQYYDLEKYTDRISFNTGSVQAKIGVNTRDLSTVEKHKNLCFVVVDNKPHLTVHGTKFFAMRSKTFYLITTNKNHPAFTLKEKYPNIEILYYPDKIDFIDVFRRFKKDYGIKRVTIQTGGTLNSTLLRLKLIDRVSIVIAPCLIGGKDTPSLISGESLHSEADLLAVKALQLTSCKKLKNNYLHIVYKVLNETEVK